MLVDDSENHLHCTIAKQIVQAAARWLNECIRVNKFVDEHPYEIVNFKMNKLLKFELFYVIQMIQI